MEAHCNNLNHKLDKLENNQHNKNKTQNNSQFYPRSVKLTKIKFTKEEMALLLLLRDLLFFHLGQFIN
jgi:hypothetical protein